MKAVIFAGGVGTRLWPLSRKKSPKQFGKIIGEKSTLQLAIERLRPEFKPEDIYISTGAIYKKIVARQLNFIPENNIIGEPEKKDVGPAVALMMGILSQKFPDEPVVILWSDHLVKNEKKFKHILLTAGELIKRHKNKIIFIGQKARFASDNLGWIESSGIVNTENNVAFHKFGGFKYKPNKAQAEKFFLDGRHCWNLGYFVSTPKFILSLYRKFAPEIYGLIDKDYRKMPVVNFDNAILEHLDPDCAYVVIDDIGWSDVGAWEALKEALEKKRADNVTKGNVLLKDSADNLIYNFNDAKLLVGVDLENLLVVNTPDVLLIAKKTSVAKIKKIVEGFAGTEHEKLT